jgi:hypothetical protein
MLSTTSASFGPASAPFYPSRPDPHGAVVRHGSLAVPRSAERDFELAEAYLGRDSVMRSVLDKAEHARRAIHLAINSHGNDSYDAVTRTVHWDPHSALETSRGGRQSAALGLGHELDHATVGDRVRDRGAQIWDPLFDNAEERRVILGSETHAAHTLGEGTRHDHAGDLYWVTSPIVT